MRERNLYQKFADKVHKEIDPFAYIYKIPDTAGHRYGKKPFDTFMVIKGIPYAIEAKYGGKEPTKYQSIQLFLFRRAGGKTLVFDETTFNKAIKKIRKEVIK